MEDAAPASRTDWPTDDAEDPAAATLAFNVAILWIVTAAGFVLVLQARTYIQKLGGWSSGRRRQPKTAAPSPPPLTKLRDTLHDGEPAHPFSKCVEVINLVTPPSGSPRSRRGRVVTPGAGRTARTLSTDPRPSPSPGLQFSTPLSYASDYTPDVTPSSRSFLSRSLFSPWTQNRQQPVAAPQVQEPQGWDPALLQACQQHESAISSLDGLQQSKEFQAHIRATHGNLDRHMDQVSTRLDTYRTLRAIDRPGFLHALTRNNVQDFETWQLPVVLGLLDVVVTTAITWSVWYSWLAVDSGYGILLAGWLLLQACLAWLPGRPSLVGRMAGVHCVQDCPDYPDHQLSAPAWRVVLAGLLDALFAGITCSASGLLSAALVVLLGRRQTAGQLLMNIYCVQEVTCGTAALPLFPSPQSKAPGSILQSSQPRAAHLRRRAAGASTPTHGTGTPRRGQLFGTPLSAAPGTNSPLRGLASNAATPVQTRPGSNSAAFNWEHTPVTVGRANAAGTGVAVVGAGAGPSGAGIPWSFGSGRRGVEMEMEITAAPMEAAACGDAGHVPWSFGSARSAALGQVAEDETPNVRGLLRAAKVAGAARAPWSFGSGRQAPVPAPAPTASPAHTQHGGHGLLHAGSTAAAATGGSFGSPAAAGLQSPWRMGTEHANVNDDGDAELRAAFGVQREVLISPALARRRV